MKIAPLNVSDPWYGRILGDPKTQVESLQGVPVETTVEMELVELLHGGPEENYRPYLHLRGELTTAIPAVELPYGVSELALRRGSGLNVDAFYDFSQRQLNELVAKGYFTDQFQVPEDMSGIPWQLPGAADFMVVAPEYSDQTPVVFMGLHAQNELELDEGNTGYDLAAYFPVYDPELQAEAEATQVVDAPEYGGSGRDVFSDMVFEDRRQVQEPAPRSAEVETVSRTPVPSGIFERLMSEIVSRKVKEPEVVAETESEPEPIVPGSAADLYFSRVSPGVDQVLSGERLEDEDTSENGPTEAPQDEEVEQELEAPQEQAPHGPRVVDGFLDFSDAESEPELAPPAMRIDGGGEEDPEAHHKAAIRRTARIRSELAVEDASRDDAEAQPGL